MSGLKIANIALCGAVALVLLVGGNIEALLSIEFEYWLTMLSAAVLLGCIPSAIAHRKGYDAGAWWFYGAMIFVVALPHAIMLKPNAAALESRDLANGGKKCPFCAEVIKREAVVCRFCGRGQAGTENPA